MDQEPRDDDYEVTHEDVSLRLLVGDHLVEEDRVELEVLITDLPKQLQLMFHLLRLLTLSDREIDLLSMIVDGCSECGKDKRQRARCLAQEEED